MSRFYRIIQIVYCLNLLRHQESSTSIPYDIERSNLSLFAKNDHSVMEKMSLKTNYFEVQMGISRQRYRVRTLELKEYGPLDQRRVVDPGSTGNKVTFFDVTLLYRRCIATDRLWTWRLLKSTSLPLPLSCWEGDKAWIVTVRTHTVCL